VRRYVVPDGESRRTKTAGSIAFPHRSRYDEVTAICRLQVRTTNDNRHWLTYVPEVVRTIASDAVESDQCDFVLDALCDRQTVQRVAECRCDVVIQSDAFDEPSSSVKHRLKTPNDVSSDSVQDSIAIVNPTDDEGLDTVRKANELRTEPPADD
jgi:hypothetical protein